ncbi:MAG: glycosyltransferase family 25 protein [Bacteroidales bacterium]|jgi:glycosyl transferase family 25|nr:glycosyltransferase family 25 protein [Bacteroidales bacterium]
MQMPVDAIYVVHGRTGYEEQEKHIHYWLKEQFKLPFEFVSEGDAALWSEKDLEQYFGPAIFSKLSKGQISCALNHFLCYEKMLQNNNSYALILEDDAFFCNNFVEKFNHIDQEMKSLEPSFMISLENTTLRFIPIRRVRKGKYVYEAKDGRCTGAYVIDKEAAKQMLTEAKANKCVIPIDWWHNEVSKKNLMRHYWAQPTLVEQGSHNGKMNSTLSQRHKTALIRLRWILKKWYKMYILRLLRCYEK